MENVIYIFCFSQEINKLKLKHTKYNQTFA